MEMINIYNQVRSMIYTIQSSENNGVVNPTLGFAKESNDLKKV